MLSADASSHRKWAGIILMYGGTICSGAIIVHCVLRKRREARVLPGFCRNCGYNLLGNVSGVCPECGALTPRRNRAENR
jgi:hypothetical protein